MEEISSRNALREIRSGSGEKMRRRRYRVRSLRGYSERRKSDGSSLNFRNRSSLAVGSSQILSPQARSRKRTPSDHTSFSSGEYGAFFETEWLS